MSSETRSPVRRRLDLKAMRPAGGETEFLTATLIDDADEDRHDANDPCELPAPDQPLGDTGLTVEEFLTHWRAGASGLDAAARIYGRMLYRKLFEEPAELTQAWQHAVRIAKERATGLRLEIRCPLETASHWRGQSLSALPFELMCDDRGYLFRQPGWSTVRRSRGLRSRELRWRRESADRTRVQVAWANVERPAYPPMHEALFADHDKAVEELAAAGRAERLEPLPDATRDALAAALEQRQPHVFIWIGHGLDSGSGLLLHDGTQSTYPKDRGCVVSAGDFAAAVRMGQVDVALLWSCHGAGTFRSLDVGVAEALLNPDQGDVAAVLASFSSLDAAAVARLSKDLLDAWAKGDGDLEMAIARARGRLDELSLTWARPVLFLRTPPTDPSPRLPVRRVPPPVPGRPRPDRLRWLPPTPQHTARYVDHENRLAQLRDDLANYPIVVLEGLSGVGKTELALSLIEELRASDRDVVFVDLGGQRSLGPLRQTLGLLVSDAPFDDDTLLLEAFAGRNWTLVLDNAEDVLVDQNVRRDLLQLLAALRGTGEGFRALVTSRHALASAGSTEAAGLFSRLHTSLDPAESMELFIAAAGPRLASAQAVPEILEPLLVELGGIPRAIILMAGQLGAEVDVPELRRRLDIDGTEAIVEADLFGEVLPDSASLDRRLHKSRLASALSLSLASAARQSDAVLEFFDVLGTFPAGLLQEMLPRSETVELSDSLTALLDHHLVQLIGDERRIVMAAPIRAWAERRWSVRRGGDGAARSLLDRIHQRFAAYMSRLDDDLGTSHAQVARLQFLADAANVTRAIGFRADGAGPAATDEIVGSLFRTAVLFAVHGGAARQSLATLDPLAARLITRMRDQPAATVAFHLGILKSRTDDLRGSRQAYDEALRIYRQIEDRLGEANTLRALGGLQIRTNDLSGARQAYDEALAIYRQIEDRLGEANTLKALGDLQARTDNLSGARQSYEDALAICRQIEDRLGEANALLAMGNLLTRTNDLSDAWQAYEDALAIYRQIEDRLGEANTLQAMGDLQTRSDDLSGARQSYEDALAIFRQIEDRLGEANTLQAMGNLQTRTNDLSGARQAYEDALAIYRQIQGRLGEANTLMALGNLQTRTGNLSGARQAFDDALAICRQIENRLGEANTLQALGGFLTRTNDLSGAWQAYEDALAICRQIENPLGEANTLQAMGNLRTRTDELSGARQAYEDALAIYRQIDGRLGEANTVKALGDLQTRTNDLSGARQAYEDALAICRQIGDRLGEANTVKALGDLQTRTNDLSGARLACEDALAIYRQIGDRLGEANTLKALGDLQARTDNPSGARQAYEDALAICRQIEDRLGEANTLQALGGLLTRTNDLSGARRAYEDALAICRQIENRLGEANALLALGDFRTRTDDLSGARQPYEEALAIFRQIDDRLGEANTLRSLGQLCLAEGKAPLSFELTTQALRLQMQANDRLGIGGTHGYLARIAARVGAFDLAIIHSSRAFRTLVQVGARYDQMLALIDLGQAMLSRNVGAGLALLLRAQNIAKSIEDPTSDGLSEFIRQFRPEGVSEAAFAATLQVLYEQAPRIIDEVYAWAEATVERGEIDPMVLPTNTKVSNHGV